MFGVLLHLLCFLLRNLAINGVLPVHSLHMIGSLRGTVIDRAVQHVLLEVGGVGYRVGVTPGVLALTKTGESLFLYVHEVIREDAHDLYGFLTQEDLQMFLQLLSVSGVGPKVANTILSIGTPDTVRKAVMSGDVETLTSVPGVGKKTAQKIVLELRGKLADEDVVAGSDGEVVSALQSLGYSIADARKALSTVDAKVEGVSERLREALKRLSTYGR